MYNNIEQLHACVAMCVCSHYNTNLSLIHNAKLHIISTCFTAKIVCNYVSYVAVAATSDSMIHNQDTR